MRLLGAVLTDFSLSHTSRITEKKVVKITSEISQMEVRFLLLLDPPGCRFPSSLHSKSLLCVAEAVSVFPL